MGISFCFLLGGHVWGEPVTVGSTARTVQPGWFLVQSCFRCGKVISRYRADGPLAPHEFGRKLSELPRDLRADLEHKIGDPLPSARERGTPGGRWFLAIYALAVTAVLFVALRHAWNPSGVAGWLLFITSGMVTSFSCCLLLFMIVKVDYNAKDMNGRTPLIRAVKNFKIGMVVDLLAKPEVDIWQEDYFGRTAFEYCDSYSWDKLFIEYRITPSSNKSLVDLLFGEIDACERTPGCLTPDRYAIVERAYGRLLLSAARAGNCTWIEKCLRKVNVNVSDECGWTALMAATRSNNYYAAKLLVEKGANLAMKSNEGKTAFDYITGDGKRFGKLLHAPPHICNLS